MPVAAIVEPADAIEAAFGPAGRIAVNAGSATGAVASPRLARLVGTLRIAAGLFTARLRGRRNTLLFDADGLPLREPLVLGRTQRDALSLDP